METLLAELPRLERKLLGTTAHELAVAQDQIVLLGRKTAKERVASFLVSLSERALKRRGVTGEQMLQILETRLDNVVYHLGLANTRAAARQMVNHGHIKVNGRKVASLASLVQ